MTDQNKASAADVIADLRRATALFQARTIASVMGAKQPERLNEQQNHDLAQMELLPHIRKDRS